MILILGMPGAGKTTQSKMLAEFLGCPWFSMGQLIRERAAGEARAQMLEGKKIDDNVTMDILNDALKSADVVGKECIVEGSPRSPAQADWWIDRFKSGQIKYTSIIHLDLAPAVALKRLSNRGRLDDVNHQVVHERMAEYTRTVVPTLAYLRQKGYKIDEIDASDNIEHVVELVHQALGMKKHET
jgi:adenylate kinase